MFMYVYILHWEHRESPRRGRTGWVVFKTSRGEHGVQFSSFQTLFGMDSSIFFAYGISSVDEGTRIEALIRPACRNANSSQLRCGSWICLHCSCGDVSIFLVN